MIKLLCRSLAALFIAVILTLVPNVIAAQPIAQMLRTPGHTYVPAAQGTSKEFDRQIEEIFKQLVGNPGDKQLVERALALLDAELRAKPDSPGVLDFKCMIQARWQTSHAIPACNEAVLAKRDPNDEILGTPEIALQYRGFAYLCLGEPQKALQDFDAWSRVPIPQWLVIITGQGTRVLALFYRGVANRRLGNERQAKLDFDMANKSSRNETVQIEKTLVSENGDVAGPQCIVDLLREMSLMR